MDDRLRAGAPNDTGLGDQADPATDYTPAVGTVSFAPGQTSATISIPVSGDVLIEHDEYVIVAFGNPVNAKMGGYSGLGFGRILNDDHTTVLPGEGVVVEGDTGTSELRVGVTLSQRTSLGVQVDWTTAFVPGAPNDTGLGDRADPATDYTPAVGTVSFAPGQTSATISIPVSGDVLIEHDEYVIVAFGNPVNAKMGGYWGLGFGRILNDD